MSSHLTLYIGPFFLVPTQDLQVESNERQCSNPACGKVPLRQGDAYCAHCGQTIKSGTRVETQKKAPDPSALGDKWVDYMFGAAMPDGRLVWLPNKHDFGFQFSNDNVALMTLDGDHIKWALEEFLKAHRDIFEAFHAKYGTELVDAYGAVPYWS